MTGNEKEKPLKNDNIPEEEKEEKEPKVWEIPNPTETEQIENTEAQELNKKLSELKDKYLRLYADFENYKRVAAKDKEELIKYSNEEFMKELLSVVDHLDLALQHSSDKGESTALTEGVEMILKELQAILEKFGLVSIEALGKPFDPSVHHAMSQIESEENDENTVVEEFRKGYMLKDRVLRASLVGVSKKPSQQIKIDSEEE